MKHNIIEKWRNPLALAMGSFSKSITNFIFGYAESHWLAFLIMLTAASPGIVRWRSEDLGFLLSDGRYVMEHGIPSLDPFTLHDGLNFIMHQWMSAVLFWNIYDVAGDIGLCVLVTMLGIITVWSIYRLSMLVSENNFTISAFFTIIAAGFYCSFFQTSRPQMLSNIIFIWLVYFLEKNAYTGNKKYLIALPITAFLITNFHAALFPVCIVLTMPYLIESLLVKNTIASKKLAIVLFVAICVGAINPYGIDGVLYSFNNYGNYYIQNCISEMDSFTEYAIIGAVVPLICLWKKFKMPLRYTLLVMVLFCMTLNAARNLMLLFAVGSFPIAYLFKNKHFTTTVIPKPKILPKLTFFNISVFDIEIFAVATALFFSGITFAEIRNHDKQDYINGSWSAVEYIYDNEVMPHGSKVYAVDILGSELEFKGYKPYMDTRMELYTKESNHQYDIWKEYFELISGKENIQHLSEKYEFEYAVVFYPYQLSENIQKNNQWQCIWKSTSKIQNTDKKDIQVMVFRKK